MTIEESLAIIAVSLQQIAKVQTEGLAAAKAYDSSVTPEPTPAAPATMAPASPAPAPGSPGTAPSSTTGATPTPQVGAPGTPPLGTPPPGPIPVGAPAPSVSPAPAPGAPMAGATSPAPAQAPLQGVPTLDDLRATFNDFARAHPDKIATAYQVITAHQVEKLDDLPPATYPDVLQKLKSLGA